MANQIFDPSNPCTNLLPLNPVKNKLNFYKVHVFDISLEDIANIADLPTGYAEAGSPYKGPKTRMRLGLPIPTLFPELREKYQEVRLQDAKSTKIPLLLSIEGSFLPYDPNRPVPTPLPEYLVPRKALTSGRVKIGKINIKLTKREQQFLAIRGFAFIKLNRKTVRLRLDTPLPVRGGTTTSPPVKGTPRISQELRTLIKGPSGLSDEIYEQAMMALLADPRSADLGYEGFTDLFTIPQPWVTTVASLKSKGFQEIFLEFKEDPRFSDLLMQYRPDLLEATHAHPKLPRYDIGLFSTFEQTWTLRGYSRGSLVNSLTLTPEEEMTIEIFTFDRRKIEEETTLTTEFERNSEVNSMTNITSNIARELSETNQMSGDIGLGLPLPAEGVPINLDASGSSSVEVKGNIQAAMNQVSEVTARVSERYKSTRQVKVMEARETGREDRVTRKIRNPNQGYALTLNCYEVLETYQVDTILSSTKQFCLLVEQPDLGVVDIPFVLAYQDRLQPVLLSKSYLSGFDAARSLYAQGWFDTASLQKAEIEEAANQSVAATASSVPEKPIIVIGKQLADALSKLFNVDLKAAARTLAEYYNPLDGKDVTEKKRASAEAKLGLFNYAFKLKTVSPGIEDRARTYLDAFAADTSEKAIVSALGAFLVGTDDEWLTNLKMLAASLVAAQLASLLLIPFPLLAPVLVSLAVIENSAGYPGLVGKAKQELKAYEVAGSVVAPAADKSTAADVKTKEPPPQLFSLQDLAMARADFDALRLHIEANRIYYINQIWRAEDPNARFERFRQSGIEAFVENRLIGFVGDRAIFPLRLSSLEEKVRLDLEKRITSFNPAEVDSADSNGSPITVDPIRVDPQEFSLPTSAVYMDGALGQCELLEPYLVERRDIERRIALAEAELAEIRVAQASNNGSRSPKLGLLKSGLLRSG